MLAPWAKLQAMLQGILQGAGPVGYCYKVLTGRAGPRFWAFLGRFAPKSSFLGVLLLDILFLDPRSWSSRPLPG